MGNQIPDNSLRVAVVDDHRLLRETLKSILNINSLTSGHEQFQVVIEAENGAELITKWDKKNPPDLVFLDINMPEMNGFETILWIKANSPNTKVIILTMVSDIDSVTTMLKSGATAYLTKNASTDEIVNAVKAVQNGGLYFTADINRILSKRLTVQQRNLTISPLLTDKEIEVLRLLSTEMTYKEISEKLKVSPRTVDGYRESLFEKLGHKTRVGLVLYSMKNGIVDAT